MCEKKAIKIFPKPVTKKVKRPKNAVAYYQCMLNSSLDGFNGQPITSICRNCKQNGSDLVQERNSQIHLLMKAYEQLGNSLRNLLTPLTNVNHTPV